jgi:hypothetical protein
MISFIQLSISFLIRAPNPKPKSYSSIWNHRRKACHYNQFVQAPTGHRSCSLQRLYSSLPPCLLRRNDVVLFSATISLSTAFAFSHWPSDADAVAGYCFTSHIPTWIFFLLISICCKSMFLVSFDGCKHASKCVSFVLGEGCWEGAGKQKPKLKAKKEKKQSKAKPKQEL